MNPRHLLDAWRARRGRLPTEEVLDHPNPLLQWLPALPVSLVTWSFLWWKATGYDWYQAKTRDVETFWLWWRLIATPTEKQLYLLAAGALLLAILVLGLLLYALVWRRLFPQLVRHHTPGARPEPLGRLYRTRPYRATVLDRDEAGEPVDAHEEVRYRLYFRPHGRSLLRPRLHTLDVQEAPERLTGATKSIHCGRLTRHPTNPRRHIPVDEPHATSPPMDHFRIHEVQDDAQRKTAIVLPGATANPELTRQKYIREPSVTPWIQNDFRQTHHQRQPPRNGNGHTPPAVSVRRHGRDRYGPPNHHEEN